MSKLPILEKLYAQKALSQQESESFFTDVVAGKVDNIVLSSVLTALKIKEETPEEIAGAANALINNATAFSSPNGIFADIVGTGGDGHNTINISSAAAIVAASCGLTVAKHGNRSVSSKSGSADLIEGFGMDLTMEPEVARQCLDQANFCFFFVLSSTTISCPINGASHLHSPSYGLTCKEVDKCRKLGAEKKQLLTRPFPSYFANAR